VFSAHGNIEFTVINNCVINRPNAAFNKEGIDILFEHILRAVTEQKLTDWVLIEALGKEALPTPEAMAALIEQYANCVNLGCRRIAVCCDLFLQKSFFHKLAEQVPIEVCFYKDETEAIEANR